MKRNGGFTLLEVMVALTILAVGLVAIMRLFPSAVSQSRRSAERTTVSMLAKTELGKVKAGGVGNQLVEWAKNNALRNLANASGGYDDLYAGWRSTVQRVGGDVDLYRVTFAVELFDGTEETFVTYVTEQ